MEYFIVTSPSKEMLQEEVNELLKSGWQLVGGVMVYEEIKFKTHTFAQAMLKSE